MGKYVVIDLEMCKVSREQRKTVRISHEIIQIGAVLLEESLTVAKRFSCYVQPEYGRIDPFIENLTGISQEHVDSAPVLSTALHAFFRWLSGEDVTAVSWSMTDKSQFSKELAVKSIQMEQMDRLLAGWIDCQKIFAQKTSVTRPYSLADALNAADIMDEGRAHDGLADAYNTALLFAKMEREDELVLNPYFAIAFRERKEPTLGFSLGDILNGLNLQATT